MKITRKVRATFLSAAMINGLFMLAHASGAQAATITAGSYTHPSGAKSVGYIPSFIGSISGSSSLPVLTFNELQAPDMSYCHVTLTLSSPEYNPGQDWFGTLTTSVHSLTSASANYSYIFGQASWQWFSASSCGMVGGQNYTLSGI